jgi:hypothetical protein
MTWAAKIPAKGVAPVIDNIITVVERDQADALSWINGGTALPDFAQIGKARRADAKFPFLAVFARLSDLRQGDEERSIDESHQVVIEAAVIGSNPDDLADTLHKYTDAVHQMIITASQADMTENLEAGDAIWDVTRKEYAFEQRQTADGKYLLVSRMFVEMRVIES